MVTIISLMIMMVIISKMMIMIRLFFYSGR